MPIAAADSETRLLPRYSHDEGWALKLPEGRYLGSVTGLQVTRGGHEWVLQLASIMEWGPAEGAKDPAARLPAVCEFDAEGVVWVFGAKTEYDKLRYEGIYPA